jgi:Flp pilus assembly protein TadD
MASPHSLTAATQLLHAAAWLEAETAARAALAADPADPQAIRLLGLAVAAMGEALRAAPILAHAAAVRPGTDHPCLDLARLHPTLPPALVARQFNACLRLTPDDPNLRAAFAEFLLDTGQPAEAEKTLANTPATATTHHLTGLAQVEQNQFPAAIASFQKAVALNPDAAASWSNLGIVLKIEGRFADSIAAHDQALTHDPHNARFRVNRAVALLKAGLWERAWQDYEARLDLTGTPAIDPVRLMPSLRPNDRLTGLTVLALHEDGFGDTLQFLRYLPLLAERGATVNACVPRPLERLMRMVPGVAQVVTDASHPPRHDFVCPMFSLPRVFGTTIQTVPPVPALALDPDLVQHWAAHLPIAHLRAGHLPTGHLRAGLVWAGQARPSLPGFRTLDRRRSAGLAAFEPLFNVPGISFISLQAGPAARQPNPPNLDLIDPMPDVRDFADTAAIIAGLDVVVSVDTSVVHLAGLVGKPVLLLDRYDGCWRWLSGRSDSPWYPDLTIFRQDYPGDWSEPMARIAASLHAMALIRPPGARPAGPRRHAFVA